MLRDRGVWTAVPSAIAGSGCCCRPDGSLLAAGPRAAKPRWLTSASLLCFASRMLRQRRASRGRGSARNRGDESQHLAVRIQGAQQLRSMRRSAVLHAPFPSRLRGSHGGRHLRTSPASGPRALGGAAGRPREGILGQAQGGADPAGATAVQAETLRGDSQPHGPAHALTGMTHTARLTHTRTPTPAQLARPLQAEPDVHSCHLPRP